MAEVMAEAYRLVAQDLSVTAPIGELTGLNPTERFAKYLQSVYAPETLTPQNIRLRVDLWSAAQEISEVAEIERALHEELRTRAEAHLAAISDPWKTGRIPAVQAFVMATLDGLWLDYMRHGDIEGTDAAIDACALFAKMRLGGS
jgi:methylaspartate ammonia-lyase